MKQSIDHLTDTTHWGLMHDSGHWVPLCWDGKWSRRLRAEVKIVGYVGDLTCPECRKALVPQN